MAVGIQGPNKKQDTPMGRRLFAMAAPMVGGAIAGPVGAAVGGTLGAKATGANNQDALLSGAMSGASQGISKAGKAPSPIAGQNVNLSQEMVKPELGSQFSRRAFSLSQDPQVAVKEGLNALGQLPQNDPLRQEYAGVLIKADMLGSRNARKY